MARYHVAGDSGRLAELADTFTIDGLLDTGAWQATGRDAIVVRLSAVAGAGRARTVRHHLTTCEIVVAPDGSARARSLFMVLTDRGPDHSGRYDDRFRVEDGAWRIAARRMRLDWVSPQTLLVAPPVTDPS
jgi:hypothetical protein